MWLSPPIDGIESHWKRSLRHADAKKRETHPAAPTHLDKVDIASYNKVSNSEVLVKLAIESRQQKLLFHKNTIG